MKNCKICNIEIDDKKKYCSRTCYYIDNKKRLFEMNKSNIGKSWEQIMGKDSADHRKLRQSIRMSENNPSTNPITAEKISKSMTEYRKENPLIGDKNPFFGKKHTDEYKLNSSKNRKNKQSYNEEQFIKQKENTPKGENHPNWNGGSSTFPYPFKFNKQLKENVKNRDRYRCMICDKETQKLAIHHIDYNKNNIDLCNLISLCYSCHPKTNFNRENWIKFFDNMTFCH
jgi:hypothetical protein